MDPATTSRLHRAGIALVADALRRSADVRIRATGSSMIPAIWPGDVLTVRGRRVGEAQTGEIAVFARERRLFAHRVVAADGSRLITQGDALPLPDEPVTSSELLGVVVAVARKGQLSAVPSGLSVGRRIVAGILRHSPRFGRVILLGRSLADAISAARSRVGRAGLGAGAPGHP
jgi:hypothetical protein